jgi:hypothetical protein
VSQPLAPTCAAPLCAPSPGGAVASRDTVTLCGNPPDRAGNADATRDAWSAAIAVAGHRNGPSLGVQTEAVIHRMRWGRWHPVSYQVAPAAFVPEPLEELAASAGIASRVAASPEMGGGLRGLAASLIHHPGGVALLRNNTPSTGLPSGSPLSAD